MVYWELQNLLFVAYFHNFPSHITKLTVSASVGDYYHLVYIISGLDAIPWCIDLDKMEMHYF